MLLRHAPRDALRLVRRTLGISRHQRTYWQSRQDALYLAEIRRLVGELGTDARSILDVGSNGCAYLDWFPWIPRRISLDVETPYSAAGIEAIKADFLTCQLAERCDVVLCLQVLEHIPEPRAFAQRLLASTRRHLIVSVPYKWPAGKCAQHVHDPVDEAKMLAWLGRQPLYSKVVAERNGTERLVCRY